jgi:hypothetical protein
VIEQVRLGALADYQEAEILAEVEPRSIHEVLEVEAGDPIVIEPVVSVRDQQLTLQPAGPDQWIGVPEAFWYNVWADRAADSAEPYWAFGGTHRTRIRQHVPTQEGPLRLYVTVTDSRGAIAWFTLDLQVVAG